MAGPGAGWVGERAEPPMRILTLLAPTASVTALLVITISLSVSAAGPLSPGCLLGRARGSVLLPEKESPGCGNLQQVQCHHSGVSRRVPDMHAVFDNIV